MNLESPFLRPTWAEVSLDAIRHNYGIFRSRFPKHVKISACLKANAYGHGAIEVARELERCGVDYLNVAFLEEAIQLRMQGISCPILILGHTPSEHLALAAEYNVSVTAYDDLFLEAASRLDKNQSLKTHIKIDSGMGRIGLFPNEEAVSYIEKAQQIPQIQLEGLYTHFACADEKDKSYTYWQYQRFENLLQEVKQRGWEIPIIHTGNTAVSMDMPDFSQNMIRVGIGIYGLYPSVHVNRDSVFLQPALTLKTKITRLAQIPPGYGISYGKTYIPEPGEWIATIPIGYADGFSRRLSTKAEVLLKGERVNIAGVICMDQCMISLRKLSHSTNLVQAGDEVVLIGKQGNENVYVEEIADWLGTINYEVTCMLAHRVPRVYLKNQQIFHVSNPLLLKPCL